MQNILLLTKDFKSVIQSLFLTIFFAFLSLNMLAQNPAQISITVNILPPYSPYYSDYSGSNAGKVLLIIRNLTATQKRIKLTGELTSNNGIKISTKSTYVPLQPIVLNPNETKQLNGAALKDIFDLNSLNVYGVDKVKLVQTSRLPEGDYNFCLQAVDMNTNQVITNTAPQGCTSFNISYPNAPILISPVAFDKVNATAPQNVIFNWMNAGTVPMNTQYIIQIAEMPEIPVLDARGRIIGYNKTTKEPNQVLNSTSVYTLNQRIIGTNYVYGAGNVPLKLGKQYAWRVIASDPSNKTGFMNDGKSAANVFVFGNIEQLALLQPELLATKELLNIISPACKTGTDQMIVGPNTTLNLHWLWKEQIESMILFGSLDDNLLQHYTKVNVTPVPVNPSKSNANTTQVFETIKYYALNFTSQGGKSSAAKNITFKLNAPKQSVNFTKRQVDSLGLVVGQTYKLTVAAVSDKSTIIKSVESCNWLLKAESVTEIPKLVIKGKLNYTFDKNTYYGANKTSIALQIVDGSTTKIAKVRGSGPFTRIQNIAYGTTDSEGNFSVELAQFPSDTGSNKFIAIEVYSPYFQKTTTNISVNIPKISASSLGSAVVYKQEPLLLNAVNLNAFNYKVTVTLTKQFEKTYAGVKPNNYTGGVIPSTTVETNYVNSITKVDAGILVGIYRKAKRSDIPKYEGDADLKSPQFPLQNGFIRVGEARTFIAEGKTQVVFDKLLLSWASDDEYYIKAILPKLDPNNKEKQDIDADLDAPEQRLAFMPSHFLETTTNYSKLLTYQLISKKPPTARIKGKIMQQWPSAPGVLYPYANQPITVNFASLNTIPADYTELLKGPNCQYYPAVLKQVDENGKVMDLPAGGTLDGTKIVATGVTDKDGNYEIDISAVMEMKNYKLVLQKYSDKLTGLTCDEKTKKKEDGVIGGVIVQANTGSADIVNGYTYQSFKTQVKNLQAKTGKGYGGDLAAGGNNGSYDDSDVIDFGTTTATDLKEKLGLGGTGGNPSPLGSSTSSQIQGVDFKAIENVVKAATQIKNVAGSVTKKYFVANDDTFGLPEDNLLLPETEHANNAPFDDAVYGSLSRQFYIEGLMPVSTVNNDANQTLAGFVVQPFGSVNLGVSVINIKELERTVAVNVVVPQLVQNAVTPRYEYVKTNDNKALGGAKLFIFRIKDTKPKGCPPGEGGISHPIKNLPKSTYKGSDAKSTFSGDIYGNVLYGNTNYYDKDVEWVLDEPIDIELIGSTAGRFTLNQKRLMYSGGNYYGLIMPNPDGGGGRFDPLIFNISAQTGISNNANVVLAPSRIAGRVMDKSSGKPIANSPVRIGVYEKGSSVEKPLSVNADQNGYFEIIDGANGLSWENNAHVRVSASPDGYNNPSPIKLSVTQVNLLKDIIQKNGGNYDFRIDKDPSSKLFVNVDGERIGEGKVPVLVKAYIKRSDGTIFTDAERLNGIAITGGITQVVKIIPEDPAYFEEELTTTVNGTKTEKITLKRIKHRMRFVITDKDGSIVPLDALKITINNGLNKTNTPGGTSFEFENVSISNYTVQIAANGTNYIPKIVDITNVESKLEQVYNLTVEKGATITGIVTLDGNPVENAKVYLDYSTSEAIPMVYATNVGTTNNIDLSTKANKAALETLTLADGSYTLKGLPTGNNESVIVHATLNTNVMVNGAVATVKIIDKAGKADFKLAKFNAPVINNVYGFPLSIESVQRFGNTNKVTITGIVDLGKNNSSFTWLNPDTKIRISNVIFDYDANGQPTLPVKLDALLNLKMKYLDKYNVKIENAGSALTIQKSDKGGAVNGQVSITDNSFNFPSSYLSFPDKNGFYLSTLNSSSAKNATTIKAIYSTEKENPTYYLSDKAGDPLKFRFVGFDDTKANPKKSYIATDGKIHLDINFTGKVKDATPGDVDVNIKDLVLDGNAIYPTKGSEALKLKLQTWNLEVNDWELDVKKGGIVSKSAVIKTGFVDVPVKTFNLRSDMFVLKNFVLNKISLGNGLLNLVNVDTTNFNLVYDQACGSDLSPHWRFSGATGAKSYVAQIPLEMVDGKFPKTTLDVKYFQMISYNDENIISLANAQTGIPLYNNPKFKFFPSTIRSDVGSFSVGGQAQISVPRINNVGLNLVFNQSKTDAKKYEMNVNKFDLSFEGKGYVKFQNDDNQPIVNNGNTTQIRGTVVEPGKFNPIKATLSFGEKDNGTVKLDPGFELNLTGDKPIDKGKDVYLVLNQDEQNNRMKVDETNDWSILKFSGDLNDPKSKKLSPKPPVYTFTVLGDIQANSDGVKMEKATALGNIKMVYDFKTGRMLGSLHMNNVEFGSYKFTGDVEVGYGGTEGFLMMGAGQLNTGTLFLVPGGSGFGTFNIGLLFANATLTDGTIKKVTQYSRAAENACWLTKNKKDFQGFFLTGGYDIINEHKGFDIGIAAVYLNAVLGVEASIGANFNAPGNGDYKALVGVHGLVNAGMSAITGTSIDGHINAHLTASAEYSQNGFAVSGAAGVAVGFTVSQYLVLKTVTFSSSQEAKVLFKYQPNGGTDIKFSLGKENATVECQSITK